VIGYLPPLPKNKDNDMHRATPITIDKIMLSIGDFRVKANNLLTLNTTQKPTGETYIKRFCNQSGVMIDIKPQKQTGIDNCYITFNPNKTAISDIQDIISDSGLILKLDVGKPIRLDLCRDMKLDRSTIEYHQVLRHSMSNRLNFAQSYDTVRVHTKTKSYEIGLYNKSVESNLDVAGIHRLETRLLNYKNINQFGINTYKDIISLRESDMLSIYRKVGKKCLPNLYDLPDNMSTVTRLSTMLETLYELNDRPLADFFSMIGIINADIINDAIKCAKIDKYKKRNARAYYHRIQQKFETVNREMLKTRTPSLRQEIMSYFAA
jgi:hypothetical protein